MERAKLCVKAKTIALGHGPKGLKQQLQKNRLQSRDTAFGRGRNLDLTTDSIPEDSTVNPVSHSSRPNNTGLEVKGILPTSHIGEANKSNVTNNRRLLLENWKKKKQEEKLHHVQQKPVFKTGVVHHPINPWSLVQAIPPLKKGLTVCHAKAPKVKSPFKVAIPQGTATQKGVVTRRMAKNTTAAVPVLKELPKTSKFKAPVGIKPVVLTIPRTPKIAKSKKVTIPVKTNTKPLDKLKNQPVFSEVASLPTPEPRRYSVNAQLNRTLKTIVKESEHLSRNIPTTSQQTPLPLDQYVTVTRGKYSDRKSKRAGLNEQVHSIPNETVVGDMPITVPDAQLADEPHEKDAVYFRNLLNAEIVRLSGISDSWEAVRSTLSKDVSEDIASQIDLTTGQTRLLIGSKFEQFRTLTHECEAGTCVPPVLLKDLQGFWEMMYMQVEGLDRQYLKLDELKANNWMEKLNSTKKKKKTAPVAKRVAPVNAARSGMRAMIEAARKKKMEAEKVEAKFNSSVESLEINPRIFEIQAVPENSSKRISLLQQVLSTGAARRIARSSPIVMKVSRNARAMNSGGGSTPCFVATTDTAPPKPSSIPSKAGSTLFNAGTTPFKASSTQPKASCTPFKAGSTPFKASSTRPKASSTPFNAGSTPFKAGSTPFETNCTQSKATSTPFKSILKDGLTSVSAKKPARKTVNFGGNLRKSFPSELNKPEVVATAEPSEMLSPPSEPPTAVPLTVPPSSTASIPIRRAPRQSMLQRLNIKDELQKRGMFIPKKDVEKENVIPLEIPDNPLKSETPPNKERRTSYRKTPHNAAKQELEITDSSVKGTKRQSQAAKLFAAEDTPNKQRRSYRKTPHKVVHQDRVSLFGGIEDPLTPIGQTTATGDLISFDTPVRRSTRLSRK